VSIPRRPLQPGATLLAVLAAALLATLVAPGSAPSTPAVAGTTTATAAGAADLAAGDLTRATSAPGAVTGHAADPAPAAAPGPTAQPVQDSDAFPVYSARDPFDQLVADTGGADAGSAPAEDIAPADPSGGTGETGVGDGTATGGTSTGGTATGDGTDPGTAPSPSSSPGPGSTATGEGGRRIELVDVYTAPAGGLAAVVTVNGSGYTPVVGDTFAGDIVLVSAEDRCVALSVDGAAVGLCEGDAVRK